MRGIVPSLNTPFDADGALDERGAAAVAEASIAAGCAGLLALAVAGEQGSLTQAEKERAAAVVIAAADGRVPVVVSVTAPEVETSVALAAAAARCGADGVLVQAPKGLEGDALVAAVRRIAAAGPPLLMLQDLDWGGGGLPIETILALRAAEPRFRCLKIETVPAGPKYSRVLAATGGSLHVSGGWAVSQMPDALARGVHAFMPTAMDHVYVRIHRLHASGRHGEARALFERALPVLAFANQHIDVSIRFWKLYRHRQGLFATAACRAPVALLDAVQQGEADCLVERALALDAEAAHTERREGAC